MKILKYHFLFCPTGSINSCSLFKWRHSWLTVVFAPSVQGSPQHRKFLTSAWVYLPSLHSAGEKMTSLFNIESLWGFPWSRNMSSLEERRDTNVVIVTSLINVGGQELTFVMAMHVDDFNVGQPFWHMEIQTGTKIYLLTGTGTSCPIPRLKFPCRPKQKERWSRALAPHEAAENSVVFFWQQRNLSPCRQ